MSDQIPVHQSDDTQGSNHESRISNLESRDSAYRPLSVTLLALLVLSIAGINLIRFVEALAERGFWASTLPVSPLYLAISGLVWSLIWTPLAWGLWQGTIWAAAFTLPAAVAFSLYYWLDRLFLRSSASSGLVFDILMTVLFLLYVRWTLKRPAARAFFIR